MWTLLLTVVALAALGYRYGTRSFNYWHLRGVKHDPPTWLVGNNLMNYLLQKSVSEVAADVYFRYPNEKIVGFFRNVKPELVVRDPEIVKNILTVDFLSFYPRGLNPHKTVIEPLLRNLFFADGDLWRLLRTRMSPAFTSGKLRAMFPLVQERATRLQARLRAKTSAGAGNNAGAGVLDARDLMARYTTDFIGAVGFGLDADSLSDEQSAFRKLGARIFKITVKDFMIGVCKEVFVEPCRHLKYLQRIEREVIDLVESILKQRNYEPSGRNDFIDLMLECQKKGTMSGESIERIEGKQTIRTTLKLTDELIAAQVFVFFAAGFETSSSATSFTLHQLAYHPDIQQKVQDEIDQVLSRHNNELSYDCIKEMKLLECAFKEGMRMFPSLGFLIRQCARPYTFPEVGVSIEPGVRLLVPLQALHNDPRYFPQPERFRPERFHPDCFTDLQKSVYMPFGEGPRMCIGSRLGTMQSLAGLAAVLSVSSVSPAPATRRRPRVDPASAVVQTIAHTMPLIFTSRTKCNREICINSKS